MSQEHDPVVLVTGASAGIGAALAAEFARHGHALWLAARSLDRLDALAEELRQRYGVNCQCVAVDLADPDGPAALMDEIDRRGGRVDILVNNAGVLHEGDFVDIPLDKHQQLIQVNLNSVLALIHRALPAMIQRGSGRILNVASTSAFNPVPSLASYAASKAFVLSLTEALSLELKGKGVSLTALCPGFTQTDMIAQDGRKPMKLPLVPNMTPEQVAREGYQACMRGETVRINGRMNRLMVESMRHPPMWLRRRLIDWVERSGI